MLARTASRVSWRGAQPSLLKLTEFLGLSALLANRLDKLFTLHLPKAKRGEVHFMNGKRLLQASYIDLILFLYFHIHSNNKHVVLNAKWASSKGWPIYFLQYSLPSLHF